ncbi:protein-disulfide reductase DsbD domain-containing protein [Breoghania sp. L-A4]|uniref:protein-disulfide reductase DsbD domain-containing protein n=1 Tax=Breoghania sp. L-A4 TaxID=2304600 RepID=UPI000E35AF8A|nr:protein-disulfide reductase DsbD domain-containing protein [Breoghania sp. L-A4]AXS39497.1 hypothetical protein D1F64_04815 [Breoghania sp. L-A4]
MQNKSSLVAPSSALPGSALLAALVLIGTAATPALAGSTSWRGSMGGEIRLISAGGPPAADGTLQAGLELRLKPGWKTYWRFPGDSGIGTSADFSTSVNLASADLAFPAPERQFDGFSTSIGYTGSVVLPLAVRPHDPAKPLLLNVTVTYGVCAEVCVPLQDELSLVMSAGGPADPDAAAQIDEARARVPRPATADDPLSVRAVTVGQARPRVLTFSAALSDSSAPAELFVEGPENSYLTVPDPAGTRDGLAQWTLPLDGLVYAGDSASLRLTLINGEKAVDQTWILSSEELQ